MEFDMGQVRAFVAVADHLHFGRAADQLFLSQQGLSKRIRRLERAVGTELFHRGPGGVELAPAGVRFLPHARTMLAHADAATAVMGAAPPPPVRVDVWGQFQGPLRVVGRFNQANPELVVELSMRRAMSAALDALGRRELDAAFGRPHDLDHPWPAALARRPAYLEPLAVAVVEGHPLAESSVLRPGDLRETGVWWPLDGSPAELVGFFRRFGDEHHIPVDLSGPNLGLDQLVSDLQREPRRVTLIGKDWPLPPDAPVRRIPIEPAPCYLWHIVWHAADRHPVVAQLVDFVTEAGRQHGWLDADHAWVPDADRSDLDGPRRQPTISARPGDRP